MNELALHGAGPLDLSNFLHINMSIIFAGRQVSSLKQLISYNSSFSFYINVSHLILFVLSAFSSTGCCISRLSSSKATVLQITSSKKMKIFQQSFLLLSLLTTLTSSATPPISYTIRPTPIWNQAILTTPSQNNAISISPDNSWLYITSVDYGTLSKLNPSNGKFVRYYDTIGKEAVEGGRFGYGQGGIEFYINENKSEDDATTTTTEGGGGSYLLYWVLDVSQQGYYSKVVCIEHDESEQIVVRWVKSLSGILNGMPQIG